MKGLFSMEYIHCLNVLLVILLEVDTFLYSNTHSAMFMALLR